MLLLTGYNQLPLRKMYWENSSDVLNTTTSNAMSRDFFEKMLSVLHMSDVMSKLSLFMTLLYTAALNSDQILKII